MRSTVGKVALLLFGSGFCALVYQTAWLRMFRMVFGASTAASAAVLAIFMGGLGFGGLLLGRRADRSRAPLTFYAALETGIALSAALSPLLVLLVQWVYIAAGGTERLGLGAGTVVRLLLSTLVLGLPTFLMGGTLPAVARAAERVADEGRRVVGLLYAVNTLGAVLGTMITTFYSLEHLGIRKSLFIAALINLLVVISARNLARQLGEGGRPEGEGEEGRDTDEIPVVVAVPVAPARPSGPRWLVPVAAAVVGFAFLLMELVWYRMLGPILGGSSYTFGLVLAVALLGIGAGGLLYGVGADRRRPTLLSFAGTCTLEALAMVVPFALGDRIAMIAAFLHPMSAMGFAPLVGSWSVVTLIVVFLPAVVAGYQFPLLIALLGTGREQVGREVGVTYAANTLGAICGSIAGGFGLIPLLTAQGAWRLVVALLLAQALVAVVASLRRREASAARALVPLATGALALALLGAMGPTAFWRHTPIGAGRFTPNFGGPNEIRYAEERIRSRIVWQADGVESTVALDLTQEYAFIVNGKSDGSALGDAPTQVLSGLIGSLLHPNPKRALVIGLGTGSTAGWMAQIPSIERVDVVELEPAILHVAEVLSPVNRDVLKNPKVHVMIGDGRELLLTSKEKYDVVFSEPSNPYRVGVASLFSADFYRAVRQRMNPGGIFLQWLQGYELDAQVVRTAYATLNSVFPAVESWQTHHADLMLVSTEEPLVHDFDRARARIETEPYRTAFDRIWGVGGLEGFYSGYIASPKLAAAFRQAEGKAINTDDRPILEFGFAKNLGRSGLFDVDNLRRIARVMHCTRPERASGTIDWGRVEEMRVARGAFMDDLVVDALPTPDAGAQHRIAARQAYAGKKLAESCARWFEQSEAPATHVDELLVTDCLASVGDPRTPQYLALLARDHPLEAQLVEAVWHFAAKRPAEAGERLLSALQGYATDPWVYRPLVGRVLPSAEDLAQREPALGPRLFAAFSHPFVIDQFNDLRLHVHFELAKLIDSQKLCLEGLAPFEPHPRWEEDFLRFREECYRLHHHPLADRAARDLEAFLDKAPPRLAEGLTQ
jgi:predicted membrane-bound spermidine synthase